MQTSTRSGPCASCVRRSVQLPDQWERRTVGTPGNTVVLPSAWAGGDLRRPTGRYTSIVRGPLERKASCRVRGGEALVQEGIHTGPNSERWSPGTRALVHLKSVIRTRSDTPLREQHGGLWSTVGATGRANGAGDVLRVAVVATRTATVIEGTGTGGEGHSIIHYARLCPKRNGINE
jgi:hypothetical protein